jgi:hypothetical protein
LSPDFSIEELLLKKDYALVIKSLKTQKSFVNYSEKTLDHILNILNYHLVSKKELNEIIKIILSGSAVDPKKIAVFQAKLNFDNLFTLAKSFFNQGSIAKSYEIFNQLCHEILTKKYIVHIEGLIDLSNFLNTDKTEELEAISQNLLGNVDIEKVSSMKIKAYQIKCENNKKGFQDIILEKLADLYNYKQLSIEDMIELIVLYSDNVHIYNEIKKRLMHLKAVKRDPTPTQSKLIQKNNFNEKKDLSLERISYRDKRKEKLEIFEDISYEVERFLRLNDDELKEERINLLLLGQSFNLLDQELSTFSDEINKKYLLVEKKYRSNDFVGVLIDLDELYKEELSRTLLLRLKSLESFCFSALNMSNESRRCLMEIKKICHESI